MKEKVLKALANPPRIFYVPYSLAMLNFFFWFLLFIILMVIFLIFSVDMLSISHAILSFFSKKDSQISQIIFANFRIFKNKIPNKLIS